MTDTNDQESLNAVEIRRIIMDVVSRLLDHDQYFDYNELRASVELRLRNINTETRVLLTRDQLPPRGWQEFRLHVSMGRTQCRFYFCASNNVTQEKSYTSMPWRMRSVNSKWVEMTSLPVAAITDQSCRHAAIPYGSKITFIPDRWIVLTRPVSFNLNPPALGDVIRGDRRNSERLTLEAGAWVRCSTVRDDRMLLQFFTLQHRELDTATITE